MLYLLVSFLLLQHLLPLLFKHQVFLLPHLGITQQSILQEMAGLERAFQSESLVVLEDTASLHPALFPSAFITVSIVPHHFTVLVIAAVFELSFIGELSRDCEFASSLFSVTVPISLIFRILSFCSGTVKINSKAMLDQFIFGIGCIRTILRHHGCTLIY